MKKNTCPSTEDLAGHFLTQAIEQLHKAADFAKMLRRNDAAALDKRVLAAAEDMTAVRALIEGKKKL